MFAIRLFLIGLLLLVDGGLGDTVKITLAGLGDAATTLVLVGLENTDLLEGLEGLAVNGAGGIDVVGGAGTTVLGGAVDLAKTADTDGLAHVDVAGTGGGADVEPSSCQFLNSMFRGFVVVPVSILGRKLVGGRGLDSVNPSGDGELSLTLQESRVGRDELLRLYENDMLVRAQMRESVKVCRFDVSNSFLDDMDRSYMFASMSSFWDTSTEQHAWNMDIR